MYNLQYVNGNKRVLVYCICAVCGQNRAVIKEIDYKGNVKTIVNRSGAKALGLLKKHKIDTLCGVASVKNGTKSNMSWIYFDGSNNNKWVKDFNGSKIFKIG